MYLPLVCIDQDGELHRWEAEHKVNPKGQTVRKLTLSHKAGFIPTGERAKELEVIERFRKFPDPRLGVDTGQAQPEDLLWMTGPEAGC